MSGWPDCDLIHVQEARRRNVYWGTDDKVFGIFYRRYDADGNEYYCPADPEKQPGVSSGWLLDPEYDLILAWEPVDVAELLREYRGESRD